MTGSTVMVNGLPSRSFQVERRPHRLRLMNASNSRIYKLAWSDRAPMHIIGTDGGLLAGDEGPIKRPFVVLAPFQRIEIWEDFSSMQGRSERTLISDKFQLEVGMGGMGKGIMGKGMGKGGMQMNMGAERLEIARFQAREGMARPGKLPNLPGTRPKLEAPRQQVSTVMSFRMMRGFLNDRVYKEDDVMPDEKIKLNQPVLWTFDNNSGFGMRMPHPMHIHAAQFRVVERKGVNRDDALLKGVIDEGWKDTVLVFARETVKVQMRFTIPGLFLYHCHNLEHEDMGMMRSFRVLPD